MRVAPAARARVRLALAVALLVLYGCGASAPQAPPDTTSPTAPAELRATPRDENGVELDWAASRDESGVLGYTVRRDGVPVATLTAETLEYSDRDLAPGTTYEYAVESFDAAGNISPRATVSATTPAVSVVTFRAVADAYVNANKPGIDYGSASVLRIDRSPRARAYVRFHVGALEGRVVRATLRVFALSRSSEDMGFDVRAVDGKWDEATLTYESAPLASGTGTASAAPFDASTWVEVDVTPVVRAGTAVVGFLLTTASPSNVTLASRESGASAPQLVVVLQQE